MSREQVLTAMNKLGHEQASDHHWHYQLLSGCVLEVHARRLWGSLEPQQVALREAEVQKNRVPETGNFTVSLVPRTAATMAIVVLDRMDEVDASQMVWLLNELPRFCAVDPEMRP